ncbi:MAG: polyprenyl synthetase family protein [Terriglobia bacterium]
MTVEEIFDLVQDDLKEVEAEFGRQVVSPVETISSIGSYLQQSGGKRLRPALLLLCARLCGSNGSSASIKLGTVVEFLHTATLVHDDIIDDSNLRRGRASAHLKWGNQTCVLAGDWMYMQSYVLALSEKNFHILEILTEVTQKMVEGELIQLQWLGHSDIDESSYLDIAARKTALLFAACGRLGAVLGGRSTVEEERIGEYGRNLGMAFQLVDDLLDFTSNEKTLGKPVLSDLKEGKVTLPLIYALSRCEAGESLKVKQVLKDSGFESIGAQEIIRLVEKYETLSKALQKAKSYAEAARGELSCFPKSDYKQALLDITHFVIDRNR